MKPNEDISFIELHRYITYIISSKKLKLDKETEDYINNISKKYFGLEEFLNMSEKDLIQKRLQIENQFNDQMKEINDKFEKLSLIKEILEIDLNYYYKQLKNIKSILKNDNFILSIKIINEKISTNQTLSDIEKQKITFYNKLLNQQIYIENIILSNKKIIKFSKKDIIKQEIFKEMKEISNETKILIEEIKEIDFDYKKLLQTYNDYELQKLLSSLDEMIFNDNSQNLKFKIIENLHKLTKKSYNEINTILKDNKFKEKLFGNLKIETINSKLEDLSFKVNNYKQINNYMNEIKNITYVCPICNYNHEMPINVILHISLHKTNLVNPIKFSFYNYNQQLFSEYSINPINKMNNHIFEIKSQMYENIDKKNLVNSILIEKINKGDFQEMRQPLSLNKIIHKVDNIKTINDFKDNIYSDLDFSIFNENKKIKKIIDEQIKKMKKNTDKNFTKNMRIINFKVFKMIFEKFYNEDDITNLYNSVIDFYDNNLKIDSNNHFFDLLFKNIIHYNNRKPVQVIYDLFKKLFKIIKGIKEQKYAEVLMILGTKKVDKEAYEYVDTKSLILLIPILRSLDLLDNISNNLNDIDDIKINEDFDLTSWTNRKNYKNLINQISNITKDDIIIQTNNKRQTEEIMEQFIRLNEIFANIDMKKLKKLEKQYDLIYQSFIYMVKNNMFLHQISNIESNKNIYQKYNEYINGTFLIITMNYMNLMIKENKNNIENTKIIFNSFFKSLSLFLTEDSSYLKKNSVIRKKVVRKQIINIDNRDDLLNDYFEDSDNEDFDENIGNEEELIEEIIDDDLEEEDEMLELFGED